MSALTTLLNAEVTGRFNQQERMKMTTELFGNRLQKGHYSNHIHACSDKILAIDISIDGLFAAILSKDNKITHYDLLNKKIIRVIELESQAWQNQIKIFNDKVYCFSSTVRIYEVNLIESKSKMIHQFQDCFYSKIEITKNHFWVSHCAQTNVLDSQGEKVKVYRDTQHLINVKFCQRGDRMIRITARAIHFYSLEFDYPYMLISTSLPGLNNYRFCDAVIEDNRLFCSFKDESEEVLCPFHMITQRVGKIGFCIFYLNGKKPPFTYVFSALSETSQIAVRDNCVYLGTNSGKIYLSNLRKGGHILIDEGNSELHSMQLHHPFLFINRKDDSQVLNVETLSRIENLKIPSDAQMMHTSGKIVFTSKNQFTIRDFFS